MRCSTKLELNLISDFFANAWKLLNQSEAVKPQEFSGGWQKLTRPGETTNEFAQHIRAKSNQRFVCKYAETAWPIRGHEKVRIPYQKLIKLGEAHYKLAHQTWQSVESLQMRRNHLKNQGSGNGENSAELDQRCIRLGEALSEFAHQIWA